MRTDTYGAYVWDTTLTAIDGSTGLWRQLWNQSSAPTGTFGFTPGTGSAQAPWDPGTCTDVCSGPGNQIYLYYAGFIWSSTDLGKTRTRCAALAQVATSSPSTGAHLERVGTNLLGRGEHRQPLPVRRN